MSLSTRAPRPTLASRLRTSDPAPVFARRLVQLLVGLALYGLGIAMIVRGELGVAPWDVLTQGIAKQTGLGFGLITILTSGVVLLLWIPLRQRPGFGTVLNALLVGPFADLALWLIPAGLDLWARILQRVPDALLWMLAWNPQAQRNLLAGLAVRGVDASRVAFGDKRSLERHLARLRCADLFLDTFPYGAHATATDALTAGLPVLTFPGNSFATRVCASIVAAAGAPELICSGPDEYTRRAIALAHDREALATVRASLQRQRDTCALYDTPAFVRRLEELLWRMQGEAERGETPVPDLRNLDTYYEIGASIVLENVELAGERDYRQRYRDKLVEWNDYAPLEPDARLWSESAR